MIKVLHISETVKGGVGTTMNVFDRAFAQEVKSRFVVPAQHADHLSVTGQVLCFERTGSRPLAVCRLIRVAYAAVRQESADVLYFQSTFALFVMLVFRLLRIPGFYIYNPHGWARLRYGQRPVLRACVSALEGRLAGLADVVVNVSHNDIAEARASGYGGQHRVIENAVPDVEVVTKSELSEPGRINLLFVGRFDRQKGLDLLLKAFAIAQCKNPKLYLHVIGAAIEDDGDAPLPTATKGVRFYDWVAQNQIAAHYAAADLVVLPSRWESLPMVILEALRSGTPVMLSETCGMPSLIDAGQNGMTVPLTVDHWAQALADLDQHDLRSMRPAARQLFEARYGLDRFRQEMRGVLPL